MWRWSSRRSRRHGKDIHWQGGRGWFLWSRQMWGAGHGRGPSRGRRQQLLRLKIYLLLFVLGQLAGVNTKHAEKCVQRVQASTTILDTTSNYFNIHWHPVLSSAMLAWTSWKNAHSHLPITQDMQEIYLKALHWPLQRTNYPYKSHLIFRVG